jgi:hypothetical protein
MAKSVVCGGQTYLSQMLALSFLRLHLADAREHLFELVVDLLEAAVAR